MIATKDIAWLAGLLEGEGCFTWQRHTADPRHGAVRITLSMCDRDVILRAAELMRARVSLYKHNGRDGHVRKTQYRIQVGGKRAAAWMMTIYPLMGARRQAKIAEILGQWRLPPSERATSFERRDDQPVAASQAA